MKFQSRAVDWRVPKREYGNKKDRLAELAVGIIIIALTKKKLFYCAGQLNSIY